MGALTNGSRIMGILEGSLTDLKDLKAEGQEEEEERRKLKRTTKVLLAEHKELREDVGVESSLILTLHKDHELQINPPNSSLPHSSSFPL
ncbi:hypothetical protein H5410_046590 [Solanum commersonii]|uniref:Uncharacterized protein n=1 Tax=Solanum commersonii TaxID=4109 RepID=A0A9J5XFY1_SOLCO|nr:hypothetical protein H5410_046590 [Solanum commersonii]